ncbi:HIT family protein [Vagococcus carniphilus]|uniref:HIT family protein n=1 Tax=Vagococcus carniphilus TaxID=218144 RepID=UPI003B5BD9AF
MNSCIFCHGIKSDDILISSKHFFAVLDIDPIQNGHIIIISKKHYLDIRDIPENELLDLINLEKKLITILEDNFNLLGVSVLQNNGKTMDQGTHFHIHLVPRYSNDYFWENHEVEKIQFDLDLLKRKLKTGSKNHCIRY